MNPEAQEPLAVVLDTNVVLDWLVFANPEVVSLVAAIEGRRLRWLMTGRMRDELAHVLARPALAAWGHQAEQVLTIVDVIAQRCADPPACGLVCSDADDQVFIDLARAHCARWLLTRDKALLHLARQAAPHGTVVCVPASWPGLPAVE